MPEDETWECRKRALQYAEMAYNARTPEGAKLLRIGTGLGKAGNGARSSATHGPIRQARVAPRDARRSTT
jgi:hypothetical protein